MSSHLHRPIRQALAGAALLGIAVAAQAAIEQEQYTGASNDNTALAQELGALTQGGTLFLSGSRRPDPSVPYMGGGTSADFYRFDLASSMTVTVTLEVPFASNMPVLGLFDGPSISMDRVAAAHDDSSGPGTLLSFSHLLAPGSYYAAVSGYRTNWLDFDGGGDAGWTYNLMISSPGPISAPVPEPESVAMLLAGLGALGLMSRRRRLG
ncbi:MAG: hypothetical protein RL456_819 [Pseudomonadota bacterium]|jgi:hypothetical protein